MNPFTFLFGVTTLLFFISYVVARSRRTDFENDLRQVVYDYDVDESSLRRTLGEYDKFTEFYKSHSGKGLTEEDARGVVEEFKEDLEDVMGIEPDFDYKIKNGKLYLESDEE